jgi:hypothetical protein
MAKQLELSLKKVRLETNLKDSLFLEVYRRLTEL